jgi:hypothetical protein
MFVVATPTRTLDMCFSGTFPSSATPEALLQLLLLLVHRKLRPSFLQLKESVARDLYVVHVVPRIIDHDFLARIEPAEERYSPRWPRRHLPLVGETEKPIAFGKRVF